MAVLDEREQVVDLLDLLRSPWRAPDQHRRQEIHLRRVRVHEDVPCEVAEAQLRPGARRSSHHARVIVHVDLQHAVGRQVREVLPVRLHRLQVDRRARTYPGQQHGRGVIAVDLNDVVEVVRGPQPAPAFAHTVVHPGVVEEAAEEIRIPSLSEPHDAAHQLDPIDVPGIEHQRCLRLLPGGAPDDQHVRAAIPPEIVRGHDVRVPERTPERPGAAQDVATQTLVVAVEREHVGGL